MCNLLIKWIHIIIIKNKQTKHNKREIKLRVYSIQSIIIIVYREKFISWHEGKQVSIALYMCTQFSKNKTIYAFLGIHPQIQLPKNNDVSVMTNNSRKYKKNHIVYKYMHIATYIYIHTWNEKKNIRTYVKKRNSNGKTIGKLLACFAFSLGVYVNE